jgi:hypothetical protein
VRLTRLLGFLDAWILSAAVDAVDTAAAWRGARSRAWEGRDARDALLSELAARIQKRPAKPS